MVVSAPVVVLSRRSSELPVSATYTFPAVVPRMPRAWFIIELTARARLEYPEVPLPARVDTMYCGTTWSNKRVASMPIPSIP